MWLALEAGSVVPLSRQIYERVKTLILRGDLQAEDKLPSSRALGKTLNVARNTVLEAYEQLLAEGYLEARRGSGTAVAKGIAAAMADAGAKYGEASGSETAPAARSQPSPLSDEAGGVSFRSGIPALDLFPRKEWGKLYQRACESLPASAFRYCGPGGVWELREAVAAYLLRVRGIRAAPERIMITSGSTQGLWLVARLLHREGAAALVEDPVHRGLVEVVARSGYRVRGIRADEYGMDTGLLPSFNPEDAERVAFVYVTPSHQYPLGGILPIQRRQALIRFARAGGSLIVEDDYDGEFRYEGAPVSSFHELAPDMVVYLGSFSKILAPAVRLGFAILPESMPERWGPEKMYTDVHTDAVSQHALAAFINSGGLERHIWKMAKLYKRKRAHLLRCLSERFGGRFEVRGQAAGLHLVAGFPGVTFSEKVLADLRGRGVRLATVEAYSLRRDGAHAHEAILGYSHLTEEEIAKGVAILADGLADACSVTRGE